MPFIIPVLIEVGADIAAAATAVSAFVAPVLGTAVIGSTTVGSILSSIAISAGLAGLSALLTTQPKIYAQKENIRQPVAARRRYYGRVKTGGVYGFLMAYNSQLWQQILLMTGQVDGFEVFYQNEEVLTTAPTALAGVDCLGVTEPAHFVGTDGDTYTRLYLATGAPGQIAFPILTNYAFPGVYTTAMTCSGVASVLVQMGASSEQDETRMYPAGMPQFNAVYRAAQVWDPRDATQSPYDSTTWKWTMNGALVVMDYIWHQDGMRLPLELVLPAVSVWIEQANICDEIVALADGGSEPRFQLAGGYQLTDPVKTVLPHMLDPMDAVLGLRADGAIVLGVGLWQEPWVTITDDNIVSYTGFSRGKQRADIRNEIRSQFVSPDYLFVEQEADPWLNETSIDVDGAQTLSMDLTWAPSHRQARVRMKIEAYRQDPNGWCGQVVTNAYGLKFLEPNPDGTKQRTIRFQIAELDVDDTFEVQRFGLDPKSGQCTFTVGAMTSQAYTWNPAVDEGTAPALPAAYAPDDVENPTSLTFVIENQQISGGVYTAVIEATIDTPVQGGIGPVIQWAVNDNDIADIDKVWTNFTGSPALWVATTGPMPPGTYDIRGYFQNSSGQISDYIYVRGIIIAYGGISGGGATPTLDFRDSGNAAMLAVLDDDDDET